MLRKYLAEPSPKLINAAKRVLHYLIHTRDFGIEWWSDERSEEWKK